MDRFLVVGLGNPGMRYRKTRHNMGFMAVDYMSEKFKVAVRKLRGKALTGEFSAGGAKVMLAKPQTYMNASGESVRELLEYYGLPLEKLIVVYDDMDIPLGKVRIRKKGGAGTHNGMKSLLFHLRSEEFIRVRIGIGSTEGTDAIGYVLGKFKKDQQEDAFRGIASASMAVQEIIENGIEAAMNRYNL
ncbi:MAG: aminoacyl-tRNA hydrolase [Clostridia bacterium]